MTSRSCHRSSFIPIILIASLIPVGAAGSAFTIGDVRTVALPSAQSEHPMVRVVEATSEDLLLEFELPALQVQAIEIDGEIYHALEIDGGGGPGDLGEAGLPTFSRLIQIPESATLSCELIATETVTWTDYHPIPGSGQEEAPHATLGRPALAGDLQVLPITFHPVRYDDTTQTLEIAYRIRVRINGVGADPRDTTGRLRTIVPRSFDQLYRQLVVNYAGPGEDQIIGAGSYVIICPDDPDVIAALEPLITWRTRKGCEVYLATTGETGTTREEIKAWLQNAYDTWERPPEYITMIGDADGSIALPNWGWSGGDTDHPYVQLSGDDLLADAHIGRISVESVDRLALYVEKIVSYESTPYIEELDWYRRACLIGDPSSSGPTCIQIMQWLKERLLDQGYAEVDTVFNSPFVSQMTTCLNRGDTICSYRGYMGMSGFGVGNIMALTNGRKMSFGVIPTCDTGSWSAGTARSEAWIRAGITGPNPIPTGGIACIGTATTGTHTRYNNCLTYGVWRGVFWEDIYTFGAALTRAKYELWINYAVADMSGAERFTHWNNLMGDPAGELWTGVPQPISADHPVGIAVGTNAVTVSVNAGLPACQGADVCLWLPDQTHVIGQTGSDGIVDLPVSATQSGEMRITVTKHNCRPYLGTIAVAASDLFVGYRDHIVDDDELGNGDGRANPGEQIALPVEVENFGILTAPGVSGTITNADPYVTVSDAEEEFGDLGGGQTAWSADDFDLTLDGGTPNGHSVRLGLDLNSGSENWHSLIEIPVVAAAFAFDSTSLYAMGPLVEPGEAGPISVCLENTGDAIASDITARLASTSPWVTITDEIGSYSTIAPGASGENILDQFAIAISGDCYAGHLAPLELVLTFCAGARDTVAFVLPVGETSSDDPTGPDAYGYYAFDQTDITYPYVPVYDWIEIDPRYGGMGETIGLSSDDSRLIALPFPFTYYGQTFTQATICTNGWLAMGHTNLVNYRNWSIPAAGAPANLIAPMWDHLLPDGENTVYSWFDAENHQFIIQWSRVRNAHDNAIENFEVILYDPDHYPTETGDGVILFQFETFNNTDGLQHYSTTGIENEERTDGVLYQYFNRYGPGAAPIGSGSAIRFVTLTQAPRGTLTGTITNATAGAVPLADAIIRVLATGETLVSGSDGIYGGSLIAATRTIVASHAGFLPDSAFGVPIVEGEVTELDFTLVDIQPPIFTGTTDYFTTADSTGPYVIETTITEYSGFAELALYYNAHGSGWIAVPMTPLSNDRYAASIPGQPVTSLVDYYLHAVDAGGQLARDPIGAPAETFTFWVKPAFFSDSIEDGPGDWTHQVVTVGYEDEWHRSSQRNHTPGGSWSWKFGSGGSGEYLDMADGALVSAPFTAEENTILSFWHWMDAEVSAAHSGYAYDGGLVEIAVDGGSWTQIIPAEGYTHLVREGSGPGPFPAETPLYSGTFDWSQAHFDLIGISGSVQFRFRFGSDAAVTQEGWYIDDIDLINTTAPFSEIGESPNKPVRLALYPCIPNPIDRHATRALIRFDLPRASSAVGLRLLDVSGRRVRTLAEGAHAAGQHRVEWDGRDAQGRPVASGVYYYVLTVEDWSHGRRLLVLR